LGASADEAVTTNCQSPSPSAVASCTPSDAVDGAVRRRMSIPIGSVGNRRSPPSIAYSRRVTVQTFSLVPATDSRVTPYAPISDSESRYARLVATGSSAGSTGERFAAAARSNRVRSAAVRY
jgi:hypothetical protein